MEDILGEDKKMARHRLLQRKKSLDRYYANPNICMQCGKVIEVQAGQSASDVRRKRFCNNSCAARYWNKKKPKRKKIKYKMYVCERCGKRYRVERLPCGRFGARKYCDKCLNVILGCDKHDSTKIGDLYKRMSVPAARNRIGKSARKKYAKSGRPMKCDVCGYDTHVDICHIRPIYDFPDSATIAEVNSLDNLTALCKNHHWEMDHPQKKK